MTVDQEIDWRRVRASLSMDGAQSIAQLSAELEMPYDRVRDALRSLQAAKIVDVTDNVWRLL